MTNGLLHTCCHDAANVGAMLSYWSVQGLVDDVSSKEGRDKLLQEVRSCIMSALQLQLCIQRYVNRILNNKHLSKSNQCKLPAPQITPCFSEFLVGRASFRKVLLLLCNVV